MKPGNDSPLWIVIGALGGLALGFMLIPLRSLTSASNLAFVFLAFTIVVAELGGRSAALVTAVVSALTLNFFLTEPYMSLAIDKADDMVAFGALAVCGLIAAAFGRRREQMSEQAERAGDELVVLDKLVGRLRIGAPTGRGARRSEEELRAPRDRPARRRRAPCGGGPRRAGVWLHAGTGDGHRPRYLPPRR